LPEFVQRSAFFLLFLVSKKGLKALPQSHGLVTEFQEIQASDSLRAKLESEAAWKLDE